MYKLIRFYNQNRKKIIKIILIIVFVIGAIQLLNFFAKLNINKKPIQNNEKNKDNVINQDLVSDKSIISNKNLSDTKLKGDTEIIKNFIENCNNGNINSSYDLLSDRCRENLFPTFEDFYNIYYKNLFNEQKRMYTIENWNEDIYQIRFTEDILSSGKVNGTETKQDYITIVSENGEKKLNVNSYIETINPNEITKLKDIEITVSSIDKYMDYEVYNFIIKNNSKNTILLDTNDDTNSIYLLDNKDMKYYFYNNEVIKSKLLVESKFTTKLQIKFNNSYTTNRKINKIIFSKLVLNYKDYRKLDNKDNYDFFNYVINI